MPDLSVWLAQVTTRWERITDQPIGEAQKTIHGLLALLEAANAVIEAYKHHHSQQGGDMETYKVFTDALSHWHTAVAQMEEQP